MGLARYLIRRVLWAIWLFLTATLITFAIFYLIPNDPAQITGVGIIGTPALMNHIRSELHLDVPAYQQYWIFVWNIVRHQSLGYSYHIGASVRWIIGQDARVTASLIFGGAVLWLAIAIPIGIRSALKPRSLFDRLSMVFVLIGISAPPLWIGLILSYVFGFKLGWAPIADYCSLMSNGSAGCSGPLHWAYHLLLPWLTFTVLFAALYVRIIRSTVMETVSEDYVRTAWAKGAPRRRVVFRHVLRNSLLPVVTMLGMDLGLAFGGSVFIEEVFNLHGIGQELVLASRGGDVPLVIGIVVFMSIAVIVFNFIVDVAYAWIDPRIRLA
jgi:peptide/nickel transport system permease protein